MSVAPFSIKEGEKGILTIVEEEKIVQYLLKMQDLRYPLSLGQL